jgi:hypothetical protein
MERSNAAHKLSRKRQTGLTAELRRLEWHPLPGQAFLGGLKDTLTALTPEEVLPRGACGPPAVLRVPARMRAWALRALAGGRLSLEAAAGHLRLDPQTLAGELERAGVELRTPRPDRRKAAGGRDLEDLRHERLRVDRRSHVASLGRENGQLGDLG